MKRIKLFFFGIVTMLALVAMTGCGIEKPTKKEITKVFTRAEIIPEDADGDDYDVEIDKIKEKSDKKKTDVYCFLNRVGKNGTVSTDYRLKMVYDDSKKWTIKKNRFDKDIIKGDTVLVTEIAEEGWKEAINNYGSINVGNDLYASPEDFISCMKVDKHELNGKDFTDVVTVSGTYTTEVFEVTFSMDMTFRYVEYSDYWALNDYSINSSVKKVTLKTMSDAETITFMQNCNRSVNLEYPYYEDAYLNKLEDVQILSHNFDEDNLRDTIRFKAKYTNVNNIVYTFEAEMVLIYYTYDKVWNFYSADLVADTLNREMPENYKLDINEKTVNEFLKENVNNSFTILSNPFYFAKDEISVVEIKDVEVPELQEGQTRVEIPMIVIAKNDFAEVTTINFKLTLEYNYTDGWHYYGMTGEFLNVVTALTGEWAGNTVTEEGTSPIKIVVHAELEAGYTVADFIDEETNQTKQYFITKYDINTHEITINDPIYYSSKFCGTVEGDVWTIDENTILNRVK